MWVRVCGCVCESACVVHVCVCMRVLAPMCAWVGACVGACVVACVCVFLGACVGA